VTLLWVFFRSQGADQAIRIFRLMLSPGVAGSQSLVIPLSTWIFLLTFISSDLVLYNKRFDTWIGGMPYLFRWLVYGVLLFGIIIFAGVENFPFIYFQF